MGDNPFLFLDAGEAWEEGVAARLDEGIDEAGVEARVQVRGGDFSSSIKSEKPKDTARVKKLSTTGYGALVALAKKTIFIFRSQCRNGEISSSSMEGDDSEMVRQLIEQQLNLSPP